MCSNIYTGLVLPHPLPPTSPSPLPASLQWLGPLLAPAYGLAVSWRNRAFDSSRRTQTSFPLPVISVGNLTVGGSGKTPMVAHLAAQLLAQGRQPLIAMRGYRARPGSPSDEALEYAQMFGARVPVLANPNRTAALRAFLPDHPAVDCILLDDGFQHRQIARNLDILLLDATRDHFSDRLLPAGFLREPVASMRRADLIAFTRADLVDPSALSHAESRVRSLVGPSLPILRFSHVWDSLRVDSASHLLSHLAGRRVLVLTGIGNPTAFLTQADRAGAKIAGHVRARDHAHYDAPFILRLISAAQETDAEAVLTTEKDWVKLEPLLDPSTFPVPILRPLLRLEPLGNSASLLDRALDAALASRPSSL